MHLTQEQLFSFGAGARKHFAVDKTASSHLERPRTAETKPHAKPWDHRLSLEGLSRHASTLKSSAKSTEPLSMINLSVGRPLPQTYPWESMSICAQDARSETPSAKQRNVNDLPIVSTDCARDSPLYSLNEALSYGRTGGPVHLVRFLNEHVERVHAPPYRDWATSLTCGTTSALDVVLRVLCNRGDSVLCDSYTYPGFIESAKPLGIHLLGVDMDEEGLIPVRLGELLDTWDCARRTKPRVLYMVPTGHNPTGATQSLERRRAIYEVAERHDLCIIEDDPYYFLRLGSASTSTDVAKPMSANAYLARLPSSYVSLDTSGRVIRLDSTSKILAPGLRIGWVTAPAQFMAKFLSHTEFGSAPSGPSQLMLHKLLVETWGQSGFLNWLKRLSHQYQESRDIMVKACEQYLASEVCQFEAPSFGMFVWIRFNLAKHPKLCDVAGSRDTLRKLILQVEDSIHAATQGLGVQVSKGSWFNADKDAMSDLTFRLTFAAAPAATLAQAVCAFAKAVGREFECPAES